MNPSPLSHKRKILFAALIAASLLVKTSASAQSTWTGPKWTDLAGKFPLSSSYDSLSRVWQKKDQGARFGGTLLVLEAAMLDYYIPGAGSALQKKIFDYLYPKTDPFKAATTAILAGIRQAQENILGAMNDLWNKVHQDHNDMIFANFTAASQSLEEFYLLQPWQRVDAANRVKLNNAINDLMVVKAWIESQTQPGDKIGQLHSYLIIVRLLVEAKAEAAALAYLAPAYDMGHVPGQGFYAWLDSLTAPASSALTSGAGAAVTSNLRLFLVTGPSPVFHYLINRNDELQEALTDLRDQRFFSQGNQPGQVRWWYRVDSTNPTKCWVSTDATCFWMQDNTSYATGSFSTYRTAEPEQIMELHKWFAYGSMVMTAWAPLRVALDELWKVAGMAGYRPIVELDQDMDAYLYARTGMESQMAGTVVSRDPLAGALDSLYATTRSTYPEEWNFVTGRGLARGANLTLWAGLSLPLDKLSSPKLLGSDWALILDRCSTISDIMSYFLGQFGAKFTAIQP